MLWNRGECVKFWDQKVNVQGHGGITYAGTVTVQAEAYSTQRLVSSVFLVTSTCSSFIYAIGQRSALNVNVNCLVFRDCLICCY